MTDENERRLVDLMMERLEQTRPWPSYPGTTASSVQPTQQINATIPSSDNTTFTITQIGSFLFASITIGGTLFAAWNGITTKIDTQKVSSDIIIEQIKKDIDQNATDIKEIRVKIDTQLQQTQATIKELSNRVDELDSTVNQLYNRASTTTKAR